MQWYKDNSKTLVGIECINPYNARHILRLSPNSKNLDSQDNIEDNSDIRVLSIIVNNKPTLFDIKKILLSSQQEYDSSSEVNSFILNDKQVWLDKATRVGLFNNLNIEKAADIKTTTLWFKNNSIEVEVDKAIKLLTAVEVYAKQCYDNTQRHYAEINQLETIDDCLKYDITAGYPDVLNITTN